MSLKNSHRFLHVFPPPAFSSRCADTVGMFFLHHLRNFLQILRDIPRPTPHPPNFFFFFFLCLSRLLILPAENLLVVCLSVYLSVWLISNPRPPPTTCISQPSSMAFCHPFAMTHYSNTELNNNNNNDNQHNNSAFHDDDDSNDYNPSPLPCLRGSFYLEQCLLF